MSNFWKLAAMGATAAAAYFIAKEVVERHEAGEDCSPKAVLKGIGRKVGKFFEEKCGCYYDDDFDEFDDFEDFELDDDDALIEFGTDDMESDKLTDDGYILEFSAEDEAKQDETKTEEEVPAPQPEPAATSEDEESDDDVSAEE